MSRLKKEKKKKKKRERKSMTARVLASPFKPQMPPRPVKPPEDDKCSLLRAFISLNIDKIIKLRFRLGNVHDSTLAFLFFFFFLPDKSSLSHMGIGAESGCSQEHRLPRLSLPLLFTSSLDGAAHPGAKDSEGGGAGRSLLLGHRGHICLRLISSDFCA